jgi:hypothetical protein
MTKFTLPLLAVAFVAAAVPAFAADLPQGVVAVPPPPAAALLNTLQFESSPELFALGTSAHSQGELADWYGKGTYTRNLGNGFSASAAIQDTLKSVGSTANLSQQYYEGAVAYKLSPGNGLSFTVTGTLGYTAGNTGYVGGKPTGGALVDLGNSDDGFLYYAITGAVDWKVDSHWTWNVINARYRNAFDRTFLTPKIYTGVTYNIDAADAVYANVGYSWKDSGNGAGLLADKFNIAVGYKYSF